MMSNSDIASIFEEIADILDIKGESSFRTRSYRKVAQVLVNLTEDVGEIYERGGLENIPGIGKSSASKIEELLKTGRLRFYEELKSQLPSGLLDFLKIPEVGPKTVKLIYDNLGIETLDELEKAASLHRLRELPRMGAKSEEVILKGIELLRSRGGRILLGVALPIARDIEGVISPYVDRSISAGSLRRMKETIGDIDILASTDDPDEVMRVFTEMDSVEDIVAKGDTKSSVILKKNDLQVDLRVVKSNSFGAALQYFTGSKEHNIKLRTLALKKGLTINEYGVFKVDSKEKVAGKSEEEVYSSLGLPYIPPELREDRGEIEAALNGELPELIELDDIKGDLHAHSDWSDGVNSLEEMIEAAKKRGYEYLAISDHSKSLKIANGLDEKRLSEQMEIIRGLNEESEGFKLLTATEVDILADGNLDLADEILSQLDVVIASVHSNFKQDKKTMTSRMIKAMENENVDIIGHPTGRLLGKRAPYEVDMERLINAAGETGTCLEINAYPDRLDLNDMHSRMAKEKGVMLAISTDSHRTSELALIEFGVATARRGWLEKKDVLNTLSLEPLLKKLER